MRDAERSGQTLNAEILPRLEDGKTKRSYGQLCHSV